MTEEAKASLLTCATALKPPPVTKNRHHGQPALKNRRCSEVPELESNPPPAEVSCEDRKKRRRGRPFGTGIDDTSHLDAIARLMAEHPSLSPTTAIRMLGISDRSVIRRLRDKFKARQNGSSMP